VKSFDALPPAARAYLSRIETLTGVPIADTALMFESLAQRRDLAAAPTSALLPATSA